MSTPSYDTAKIAVSPGQLLDAQYLAMVLAKQIGDDLSTIMDKLNSLQLSWFGGSAAEMQAFSDQWGAAVTSLFGPGTINPGDEVGAVNQLIIGLTLARQNYSQADASVSQMFSQLIESLLAPAPATAPAPASLINTDPKTPVTFINVVYP